MHLHVVKDKHISQGGHYECMGDKEAKPYDDYDTCHIIISISVKPWQEIEVQQFQV